MSAKIATCCYCGSRSVLVFDQQRHELTCANCAAPLHEMKCLPKPKAAVVKCRAAPIPAKRTRKPCKDEEKRSRAPKLKSKKKRKRKPLVRRVFEEIWDVVEDIFD